MLQLFTTGVYFKVELTGDSLLDPEVLVVWETVLDNHGNGYQPASGEFVAPRAGIYQFTIATMNAQPNKEVRLEMRFRVSNGNALCQVYANADKH